MPSIVRETDASKISSPILALANCLLRDNYLPALHDRKFDPVVRPHIEPCLISILMVRKHSDHAFETCVRLCFRSRAKRAFTWQANPYQ
jgi:hypothetical protein